MNRLPRPTPALGGQQLSTDLPADLPAAEEVSAVLREVLADPEFVTAALPLRERIMLRISEALSDAWNWLRQLLLEDGSGLMTVLAILIPVAALAALGVFAVRHGPAWLRRDSAGDEEAAGSDRKPRSARDWLHLARARAGEGDYRPAASALYQGFLLTLDRQGALAFHPSKTPGDYALEIDRRTRRGEPATAAGAAGIASGGRFLRSFQRLSFGQEAPGSAGYADLEALARDAGCAESNGPPEAGGTA